MIGAPRVFDEAFLPQRLLHRDAELNALTQAWSAVRHGAGGRDVLVSGPSGVGKTALTRFAGDRLEDRTGAAAVEVRCLGRSGADILRAVLESPAIGERSDAVTMPGLIEALRAACTRPTVVILDEADAIATPDVLERLAGVAEISLVAIIHDPADWLARINRDSTRWAPDVRITLDRYGVDELADILERRADLGLVRGAVTARRLEEIADDAAGVARRGIQTLRAAAELAGEAGRASIDADDVEQGAEIARQRIRTANLRSLAFHHHVLYWIVHGAGEIAAADLHERYDDVADRVYTDRTELPLTKRDRRTKLAKLGEYDLVEAAGESSDRVYAPVDGTIAAPIDLDVDVAALRR